MSSWINRNLNELTKCAGNGEKRNILPKTFRLALISLSFIYLFRWNSSFWKFLAFLIWRLISYMETFCFFIHFKKLYGIILWWVQIYSKDLKRWRTHNSTFTRYILIKYLVCFRHCPGCHGYYSELCMGHMNPARGRLPQETSQRK